MDVEPESPAYRIWMWNQKVPPIRYSL